jgi:hypothetical protein
VQAVRLAGAIVNGEAAGNRTIGLVVSTYHPMTDTGPQMLYGYPTDQYGIMVTAITGTSALKPWDFITSLRDASGEVSKMRTTDDLKAIVAFAKVGDTYTLSGCRPDSTKPVGNRTCEEHTWTVTVRAAK